MRIAKSHIFERAYLLDEELSFLDPSLFADSYPLLGIDKCHVKGELSKEDKLIKADLSIAATITLEDSYTAKPFKKKISLEESFDIMEDEDGEGEGFIVPGKAIELEVLVVDLIRFSLPMVVKAPDSKLPSSGEGYSILSEEEAKKSQNQSDGSPFDVLKDLDVQ